MSGRSQVVVVDPVLDGGNHHAVQRSPPTDANGGRLCRSAALRAPTAWPHRQGRRSAKVWRSPRSTFSVGRGYFCFSGGGRRTCLPSHCVQRLAVDLQAAFAELELAGDVVAVALDEALFLALLDQPLHHFGRGRLAGLGAWNLRLDARRTRRPGFRGTPSQARLIGLRVQPPPVERRFLFAMMVWVASVRLRRLAGQRERRRSRPTQSGC